MTESKTTPWKHIDTAPKDGSIVLTGDGTATYVTGANSEGWFLCNFNGGIPSCCEEGIEVARLHPVIWRDL